MAVTGLDSKTSLPLPTHASSGGGNVDLPHSNPNSRPGSETKRRNTLGTGNAGQNGRVNGGNGPATAHSSQLKHLKPFNNTEIKVLLLENVHQTAMEIFQREGWQIESHAKSLPTSVLIEKIKDVNVIGIRSKTQLTAEVLKHAKRLNVIGCFCIGTNQVDLEVAGRQGIVVFNSPFSNSRSVAELMIAEIITLSRQLGDRNRECHANVWRKVSSNCYEIRGKTIGIVGYGHIGSQLSVLAEAMGMSVVFYDVENVMPLGRAESLGTMREVFERSDFVTLHVPETEETQGMVGEREVGWMKKGAYLLNASRGTVVDIDAIVHALKSSHLAGAAFDVYPTEPHQNCEDWVSPLQSLPNVILTPHIGGSTEEAQLAIGMEVATNVVRYINNGTTVGSVNFPEIDLRIPVAATKASRVLCAHWNVPGVLKQINNLLSTFNIDKQICDSKGEVAYLMADINTDDVKDLDRVFRDMAGMRESILVRVLY